MTLPVCATSRPNLRVTMRVAQTVTVKAYVRLRLTRMPASQFQVDRARRGEPGQLDWWPGSRQRDRRAGLAQRHRAAQVQAANYRTAHHDLVQCVRWPVGCSQQSCKLSLVGLRVRIASLSTGVTEHDKTCQCCRSHPGSTPGQPGGLQDRRRPDPCNAGGSRVTTWIAVGRLGFGDHRESVPMTRKPGPASRVRVTVQWAASGRCPIG